jgi:hypothetical protein
MKAPTSTSFTTPAQERVEDHPLEALPDEASSPESPLLDMKAPSWPEATARAPGQQIHPCTSSTQSQVESWPVKAREMRILPLLMTNVYLSEMQLCLKVNLRMERIPDLLDHLVYKS